MADYIYTGTVGTTRSTEELGGLFKHIRGNCTVRARKIFVILQVTRNYVDFVARTGCTFKEFIEYTAKRRFLIFRVSSCAWWVGTKIPGRFIFSDSMNVREYCIIVSFMQNMEIVADVRDWWRTR